MNRNLTIAGSRLCLPNLKDVAGSGDAQLRFSIHMSIFSPANLVHLAMEIYRQMYGKFEKN